MFKGADRVASWARQGGQAVVEVLIATLLLGLVLTSGQPSVLQLILTAIQQAYDAFLLTLNLP